MTGRSPVEKIHGYLLEHLLSSTGRVERIGPFVARIHPRDDNPFLNYAAPEFGARPTIDDVRDLADFFVAHHRVPRLEYLPAAAPGVEAALTSQGFRVENRLPLMVFRHGSTMVEAPAGIRLLHPSTRMDCAGSVAAQNAAYGEREPDESQIDEFEAAITRGVRAVAAADQETNEIVGAGICTVPRNGVTELASMGVIEAYRSRGIATALASALARQSDAPVVFLMPAHDAGRRVYERAGFELVKAEILHIALPRRQSASTDDLVGRQAYK